jgi:hypothetical protein
MEVKKHILIAVVMICIAILAGCSAAAPVYSGTGSRETTVSMSIATADGKVLFDDDVTIMDNSPTAYMALEAAANAKSLPLEINAQDTPDIMFLNGIDGIYSEDPKYWVLYVNGEKSEFGMGIQTVEDGDAVAFIYQDRAEEYQKT